MKLFYRDIELFGVVEIVWESFVKILFWKIKNSFQNLDDIC